MAKYVIFERILPEGICKRPVSVANYKTGKYETTEDINKVLIFDSEKKANRYRARLDNSNEGTGYDFCVVKQSEIESLWIWDGCFKHVDIKGKYTYVYEAKIKKTVRLKRQARDEDKYWYRKTRKAVINLLLKHALEASHSGSWNTRVKGKPTIEDDGKNFMIRWRVKRIKSNMWPCTTNKQEIDYKKELQLLKDKVFNKAA